MKKALSEIKRMLHKRAKDRPMARDLWESFGFSIIKECSDCYPEELGHLKPGDIRNSRAVSDELAAITEPVEQSDEPQVEATFNSAESAMPTIQPGEKTSARFGGKRLESLTSILRAPGRLFKRTEARRRSRGGIYSRWRRSLLARGMNCG